MSATNSFLVYSVSGNYVTDYANADKNLKDWTIIKDNKVISIADIVANDMLYYDNTTKIAVVYNNTVTGAVSNVYTTNAKVADKTVTYSRVLGKLYIDYVDSTINETNFNVVKAGGNATVYYAFNGAVNFITGTKGEVATTTKAYIVTSPFGTYSSKDKDYIYASLSDGENTLNLDIPVSQLLYASDYSTTADATAANITMSVKSTPGVGSGKATLTDGTNDVDLVTKTTLTDGTAKIGALVLVKTNAKGEVIGLYAPSTANLVDGSADLSKLPALGATTKKITTKNTPVYVVKNTANSGSPYEVTTISSVTATTLGAYTKEIKSSVVDSYVVDGTDLVNGTADYIVVYTTNVNTVSQSTVTSSKQVVVKGMDKFTNADGATEVANLRVIEVGSEEVTTYNTFEDATDSDLLALVAGDVISLGFDKNGAVVTSDTGSYNLADLTTDLTLNDSQFAFTTTTASFASGTTLNYHSDADHTSKVYFVDYYNTYKLVAWTDIDNLLAEGYTFGSAKVSEYKGVTDVVDVLVIYAGTSSYASGKALVDAITDNAANFEIAAIDKDSVSNEADVKAALEAGIQTNVRALGAGYSTATVTVTKEAATSITPTPAAADHYNYKVVVALNGYTKTFSTVHVNTLTA